MAIGHRLATDWQRIEDGLVSVGRLDRVCGRPNRPPSRHFGGLPYSILVPRPFTEVASDWYDDVTMRANPVSIYFLRSPLIGAQVW